jgi:FkbM family methyltransferase
MSLRKRLKVLIYGSLPGARGSFPYFGTRVYFPNESQTFLAACDQGVYESANVSIINSLVRPATTFVDVGANIGLMSLPVLKANPDINVVAFEASPNVLPFLERTIAESSFTKRWTLVPKVVGAREGSVEFSISADSTFDGIKATGRVPGRGLVQLPMTTIDRWWHDANAPSVSVIKVDVEGAELQVIAGARDCIAGERPHLLMEWNRSNLRAYGVPDDLLLETALDLNYTAYSLPGIVSISSVAELRLHMALTESFLLAPNEVGR